MGAFQDCCHNSTADEYSQTESGITPDPAY